MNRFIIPDKLSKKARRKYFAERRHTWGELNPVTRSVPSGKTYNRKKEKERTGREIRNGSDAGFLLPFCIWLFFDGIMGQKSNT